MAVTVHYVGFHPTLILEGFDEVRRREPVDRVYLLYDGKSDPLDRYKVVSRRNARKVARELSFFKPVKLPVNPLSTVSVFSRLYAILHHELVYRKAQKVYIDVTDMPSLMAAAAGAVAMMFENVEVYGVISDVRGDFIPDPRTPEFDDWIEQKDSARMQAIANLAMPRKRVLPPVQATDSEGRKLKTLLTLYSMNGAARSVMELIRACGDDPEGNAAVKAYYSRLLKEMEEEGLIEKAQEGRERRVELTEFGKALVRALVIGEHMARRFAPSTVGRALSGVRARA